MTLPRIFELKSKSTFFKSVQLVLDLKAKKKKALEGPRIRSDSLKAPTERTQPQAAAWRRGGWQQQTIQSTWPGAMLGELRLLVTQHQKAWRNTVIKSEHIQTKLWYTIDSHCPNACFLKHPLNTMLTVTDYEEQDSTWTFEIWSKTGWFFKEYRTILLRVEEFIDL